MKISDLIKLSLHNLFRRKLRTFLTVLGVLIGTTSIVIMLSIAIGQSQYFYTLFNANNELTTVTVRNYNEWQRTHDNQGNEIPNANKDVEQKKTTDAALDELRALPGVKLVYPVIQKSVLLKRGLYICNTQITGMPAEGLKDLDLNLYDANDQPLKLNFDEFGKSGIQLLYGEDIPNNFYNPRSFSRYGSGNAGVDLFKDPTSLILNVDGYYNNINNVPDSNGKVQTTPKRHIANFVGKIKKRNDNDYQSGYNVYTRLEPLLAELKKEFRQTGWEGQTKNKAGRWNGEVVYDYIVVRTEDSKGAETLAKTITDMGYQADSAASFISEMNKQQQRSQFMFGGIGAIALLVAAIGIANTMMMSIYERTKGIGVFKVLGCKLGNIRNMFLIEAGSIGFFGGVLGLLLSTGISYALNNVQAVSSMLGGLGAMGGGESVQVSIIPFWLYCFGLLFATGIGMLAGLLPALRAMRLSPLEALRTE